MKATHIDYKRPGCIRIEGAPSTRIFTIGKGWHDSTVICAAPGTDIFDQHYRKNLPVWVEPTEPEDFGEDIEV